MIDRSKLQDKRVLALFGGLIIEGKVSKVFDQSAAVEVTEPDGSRTLLDAKYLIEGSA